MTLPGAKSIDDGKVVIPSYSQLSFNLWLENGEFLIKSLCSKELNKEFFINERTYKPGDFKVTPQEELHAKFFNDEGKIVIEMTDLELRAHREELSSIAFEARARLTRVDSEEKERRAKNKKFSIESIDGNVLVSDAIGRIKERGKRINKLDRIYDGLIEMGIEPDDARRMVSARNVRDNTGENAKRDNFHTEELKSAPLPTSDVQFTNPFRKIEPIEPKTEVSIIEETNTIIITQETTNEPKAKLFNPFKK